MQNVIEIPEELAHELDRFAGAEHKARSAYVVDVLWRDVRRHNQREALMLSAEAWSSAEHPELSEGGAAYVDRIRSESDERFDAFNRG